MAFLTPLFLAGLLALAVPLIVHLIHRERHEVVPFPSLMFLQKIPYRTVKRQKIRHLLLFALRCLAIALLALAFARPFFRKDAPTAASGLGARELVILLDRSYSMGYGDRWQRAVAEAKKAIDGVAPEDRATLVTFADAAEAESEGSADRAALTAALNRAKVGSGATRYEPALALAQKILVESQRPRREIVMISDFQRIGWEGHEDVKMPPGTTMTPVSVSDGKMANVAVAGVEFKREVVDGRDRVTPTARLTNTGDQPASGVGVSIEINGRVLETKPATVPAKSAGAVTFAPIFLSASDDSRGTIKAGSDALPADNAFHFVLSRGQSVSVLLVEPADAPQGHSLYLTQALAIGDRPPFRVDVRRESAVTAADMDGRTLVILNDAAYPKGEAGRRLAERVKEGTGLLVASGPRGGGRGWPAGDELGPAPGGEIVDRMSDRGGTLGYLDRSHPVFGVFSAPRSGDWAATRFYRYRKIQRGDGVLARFDDGAPALIERKVGKGRVLVWASSLDAFWTDLPVQPVFLPFVHQLARHAAGFAENAPWVTAGQGYDVLAATGGSTAEPAGADAAGSEMVVVSPSGERKRLAADDAKTVELSEQGFYELRRGDRARVVAVNLDATESDLTTMEPQQIVEATAASPAAERATAAASLLGPAEQEKRQLLWWYLLAGVLMLLLAETMVGNRLSRA